MRHVLNIAVPFCLLVYTWVFIGGLEGQSNYIVATAGLVLVGLIVWLAWGLATLDA